MTPGASTEPTLRECLRRPIDADIGRALGSKFVLSALLLALGMTASSCDPIEPRPIMTAPMNTCPCEAYEPGASTSARCSSSDRCEIFTAGGRPEFPFWIVVHVPDTSVFAPGLTYVFYSDAQGNPAFREPPATPGAVVRCRPPLCLPLAGVVSATGSYKVTRAASRDAGYPLLDGTSIPVRVVYEQIGNEQQEEFPSLPLGPLFASSMLAPGGGAQGATFSRAVPAGRFQRVFYPEPPFDEVFPPTVIELSVPAAGFFVDDFILGVDQQLDDPTGDSREATVKRVAGLDGWRVWLVDRPSRRRISVVRTLSGTEATVRLHTTGEQRSPGGGLGDDVEAILAPPRTWMAVPRLVTRLFSGAGLKNLVYPPVPPPVSVSGVVAQPTEDNVFLGYSAHVYFESESLATTTESTTLLQYSTDVTTDERGRFATVLPPGRYMATVEPAEGTGYAKWREAVVVDRVLTALRFSPPPRTIVRGRAVLTDGRPLSDADVLALPSGAESLSPNPRPRPGRARTDEEGRFAFELDAGPYLISVVPKAGTGFPRVVIRSEVPSSLESTEVELPGVRVPAPTRLSFTLRDPSPTGNPIARAVVRIFARPSMSDGERPLEPVEIGNAMTESDGSVEILLAEELR